MVEPVPESIDFSQEEAKILEYWKKIDAFKTSLKLSKGKPRYTFYDGPPFATGLPHYGHILAGTIKDIVTRYAHQNGFHVERRFGWDTHGLPVEYEIDKSLGIKGPEDVMKMGIANYNAECRKIVMRYAEDWETIVNRMGRWIDFENDYKTLYPWFMESIWWVFKQLFEKGLVYRGFKVMPFSTACSTPLSNFESGQNYKEVVDPAVIVSFPLDDEPGVSILAWTTTPWTLPSNLALCVNAAMDYVRVKEKATEKVYIMMEARLSALFKSEEEYEILDRFKGETLKGKTYLPLFPYYANLKTSGSGAFRVLTDSYVTEESGTGIVHQAPYFGEDDYRVCLAAGIISRDQDMICPVDDGGRFILPVSDFAGQHVKDADKNIIKMLKDCGRLVNAGTIKHSYPFCWRSETPLIYRAVPSWFIRVEQMSQQLLDNNQKTYWVPDFVKEKRFGNWLRDARDWAVSRNRYWGTPIPIWTSEDGEEVVCVGSIAELKELTGIELTDLHRENVDGLTIPSKIAGRPPLRRVSEVFDCWFESGSMPYAQVHYPFENRKEFEDCFPADFIAEGIDQTRGWFYTLLVLSTALFNKPPFKNLIVNGLVLASDGQKMSKKKKNYPDPMLVVNKFGADALRLYLINSPVVRAENLRFKEEGVRDIIKDVFLPWYNAYRFFVQNLERLEREDGIKFVYEEESSNLSTNIMDRWIISYTQSLLLFVHQEMAAYRLYTVVPRLVRFVDYLTNWYVRMNRKRLKGDGGKDDCHHALQTLFSVLFSMIRVMAPFTPFLTELMYRNLRHLVANQKAGTTESVHFLSTPESKKHLIDTKIENAVSRMQVVIELGRVLRDRRTLPIKYPLPEVIVILREQESLDELRTMEKYILEELNVRALKLTTDKDSFGVSLRAEPDHRIGARLKGQFKAVMAAIKTLTDEQLQKFLADGQLDVLGNVMGPEDLRLFYQFTGDRAVELAQQYETQAEKDVLVLLNVVQDQSMKDEGLAREAINLVQKLRKEAHVTPSDAVTVYYEIVPPTGYVPDVVNTFSAYIEAAIKVPWRAVATNKSSAKVLINKSQKLQGADLVLTIQEGFTADWAKTGAPPAKKAHLSNPAPIGRGKPSVPFVNLCLDGLKPGYDIVGNYGTVLLCNPAGASMISFERLMNEVARVFGLHGRSYMLTNSGVTLDSTADLSKLDGTTLTVVPVVAADATAQTPSIDGSTCRFVHVKIDGKMGTVLLENPSGYKLFDSSNDMERKIRVMFETSKKLSADEKKMLPVTFSDGLDGLHAKTLYLI
ncbi:hypothetical protein OUZ56_030826 [Daphnia magna]|uniref:isoleucine--tRNA ligase n=1 Tax=Daphnia magna TaxID=35525 RepID=A0ABQ9ZSL5_9CRUS|nr:hypothetical protein OUZ56_030826 [Daphnia magna]